MVTPGTHSGIRVSSYITPGFDGCLRSLLSEGKDSCQELQQDLDKPKSTDAILSLQTLGRDKCPDKSEVGLWFHSQDNKEYLPSI